jgi:eukaryotic-like serine/threonine-protein kinase
MAFCPELALQTFERLARNAMKEPTNRWQKLKDIFNDVGELESEARRSYLSKLRLNERTLFEELSELLEAEKDSAEFLQKPLVFDSEHSFIGETVGHYKIVREVGRGGMGAVFEAVREDGEFDQKTAVKLTNRSLFSDELIRRFRIERQILAKLEHANIVRLLDGGITAHLVPYFVMEFVEGVPLTEFCRQNDLGINERLALFLQVCEAVSYAHRQLVVHRDLKPSNILVTADGQVKLLDFGIAKLLDSDEPAQTAGAPLTPEYAAPEQIKGESITTATDTYGLGVILYELLTERAPFEIYGVERADLLRGVCENEPLRPSSVIDRSLQRGKTVTAENAALRTTASRRERRTNPKSEIQNPKSLKGDLDNIILKSLRKEKEQRYASVEHLADDIRAYLHGLPVKAHPQSFAYRVRKLLKRNRLVFSIGSASLLLVLAAGGVAFWQALAVQKQKQIAEHNFNQVRKIANSLVLDYHDEIAKLEGSTGLREKIVTDALEYLDAVSSEETDNAELLKEMAIAYRKIGTVQGMPYAANLGKTDEAVKNHEKGIALLEKALSLEPENLALKDELVSSYSQIGQVLGRTGKNQYETYRKAVEILDESIRWNEADFEKKIYRLRLKMLMAASSDAGELEQIEDYKEIIGEAETLFSQRENDINLVATLAISSERIGQRYRSYGQQLQVAEGFSDNVKNIFEQAAEYSQKSLQYMVLRKTLDPNDSNNKRRVFVANLNLSSSFINLKKTDEAEKYWRIADDLLTEISKNDPENKETALDKLSVLKNRLEISIFRGKHDLAFETAGKAIEIAEIFDRLDPSNYELLTWLGYFYNQQLQILKIQEKNTQTHEKILENIKKKYVERFKTEPSFTGFGL